MTKGVTDEIVQAGFKPVGDFSQNNNAHWPEPSAYIQWKGTDVCMDFHCECGAGCHFDGDFAYYVKCPHCDQVWEMPHTIYPRKATGEVSYPKDLAPDEDFTDEQGGAVPVQPPK